MIHTQFFITFYLLRLTTYCKLLSIFLGIYRVFTKEWCGFKN